MMTMDEAEATWRRLKVHGGCIQFRRWLKKLPADITLQQAWDQCPNGPYLAWWLSNYMHASRIMKVPTRRQFSFFGGLPMWGYSDAAVRGAKQRMAKQIRKLFLPTGQMTPAGEAWFNAL